MQRGEGAPRAPAPPPPRYEEDAVMREPAKGASTRDNKPAAFLARQRQLGSLGGKCAGSVGENKFLVEVAVDGRARCQLRTCKEPLRIGELRLGKRPPSLRHGHNPKVTWYHPECAMKAFLACSKKSRVVESVEDIDHGWDALSEGNQAFVRSVIEGAPKAAVPRVTAGAPKLPRKPQVANTNTWQPRRGDACYSLWRGVWYPARIATVVPPDTYEVHYSGWGTQHDHATSRRCLRHKDYDFEGDPLSKKSPQPSEYILKKRPREEGVDEGQRTGLYRSPSQKGDGPLHNLLDLFEDSEEEEEEEEDACEVRRVGGPWRRYASRAAAARAFPGALTAAEVARLITAPDGRGPVGGVPRRMREAFEARDGTAARPVAPPPPRAAPTHAHNTRPRPRPGGLRSKPPPKKREDLGYEPRAKSNGDLNALEAAARVLISGVKPEAAPRVAAPPGATALPGRPPVPVKLSAVKVKQLLASEKADMRGEELCAALDAGGPGQSQDDYGRCGGMLSGRLGPNKFCVDYERQIRSKCKRLRCKRSFNDGELRVGKIPPRARKDVPARRVHWYHPACIFKSFERASKKTKTIDDTEDMEGFSELKDADKADLTSRVAAWAARKQAMNATYKPKKRKRRSGEWLPSPASTFDAEASDEDEAVDLLVAMGAPQAALDRLAARSIAEMAVRPPLDTATALAALAAAAAPVPGSALDRHAEAGDGVPRGAEGGRAETPAEEQRGSWSPPAPPEAAAVPAVEATPELAPAISVTPKPTPSQPTVDPAVERLRLELQSKNAELEALRQQLAARAPCEHVARPDDAARYQAAIEAQQAAARDAQNAAAPYQDRLLSPPPYSPPI